ncbi:MAG TPA: glycosyltransferase family 2 protein [Solirubrobacteraceae bacterium]|nr:glycosyltransferase family 2 protein [Solirubrobacteraceae bacterium]
MSDLSVVIPTLGRRPALARALARLRGQPALGEVLLVADAQADHAAVERTWKAARLPGRLLHAGRPGASAARNAGWRAARGAVVLFLDDDVLVETGTLGVHARAHTEHPAEADAVLGGVRWADGLRVTAFMRWVERGLQFDFAALAPGQITGWWHFYTAHASVKRSLLARAGGFDEEGLPFGYEDLDVAKRMAEAGGLRLRHLPAARAEHEHAMTLEGWRAQVARIAWAERRFVARHPEVAPFFHDRFAAVSGLRPRGRAARVVDLVPAGLPGLGPRVHAAARAYWEHELAAAFLAAWEAAAGEHPGPPPRPETLAAAAQDDPVATSPGDRLA